ncbi:hypothetical protein ZIOFF_043331 [Zingiber officinale]|uniref:Malic enzyme NAD-binding domain-containing protein n=1 Tax=Zingiber officinale TaxID=94328 RepID=A0A8J5KYQ0_ZINOF|nr:hypothetical protein ZIOFF_043330 [Zingiber officinale]KAG6495506.1 hypothetical protein ZIOFF_043331 [Zingiber officinale]
MVLHWKRLARSYEWSILSGLSTKEVVEAMANFNEIQCTSSLALILAQSNPTSQSECSVEEAYTWSKDNLDKGMVYPPFPNIRKIFAHIAANVAAKAYELRLVSRYPHPKDFMKYAESFMYNFVYHPYR